VNTLNDTLYWAILTLTGIGQPFEVVTAGGRIATVLSIAVALIVVPGQLAKLATVAGAQDIMSGMFITAEGSSEDSFDSMDEVGRLLPIRQPWSVEHRFWRTFPIVSLYPRFPLIFDQ